MARPKKFRPEKIKAIRAAIKDKGLDRYIEELWPVGQHALAAHIVKDTAYWIGEGRRVVRMER